MKTTLIAGIALMALAGEALAQDGKGPARLDLNGDGAISREEAQAAREQMFARLDSDGDGAVTQAEMDAAKAARQQRRFGGGGGGGGGEGFARLDVSGDGQVSRDEFMNAPNPLFERFDQNKDGMIDASELPQRRQRN